MPFGRTSRASAILRHRLDPRRRHKDRRVRTTSSTRGKWAVALLAIGLGAAVSQSNLIDQVAGRLDSSTSPAAPFAAAHSPQRPDNAPVTDFVVVHVDQNSDQPANSNLGSASSPFRSLAAGLTKVGKLNSSGTPVKLMIHPGVYRTTIALEGTKKSTDAPIVLEGARQKGSVISGADVWRKGWRQVSERLYSHRWPYEWGLTEIPPEWRGSYADDYLRNNPLLRRQEMVFVQGRYVPQTLTRDELQNFDQAFYVGEGRKRIFLRLPVGVTPQGGKVEVATRPLLLSVNNKTDVTVKNLVFRYAASPMQGTAAQVAYSDHITIVDSDFEWNNWTGLGFYLSNDVIVSQTTADHNGNAGLTGALMKGLWVEDTEASYNGWRAAQGWDNASPSLVTDPNFIDFAAGPKFLRIRDATFLRYRATNNQTAGLWLDYDNARVDLIQVELMDNWTQGLHVEASQGPLRVIDSKICGNESGIVINNASDGQVTGTLIADNRMGQIWHLGSDQPRPVQDSESGENLEIVSRDWVLSRNQIGSGDGQFAFRTYLTTSWDEFVTTLSSDANQFTLTEPPGLFQVAGGEVLDLEEWRARTGHDMASLLENRQPECL